MTIAIWTRESLFKPIQLEGELIPVLYDGKWMDFIPVFVLCPALTWLCSLCSLQKPANALPPTEAHPLFHRTDLRLHSKIVSRQSLTLLVILTLISVATGLNFYGVIQDSHITGWAFFMITTAWPTFPLKFLESPLMRSVDLWAQEGHGPETLRKAYTLIFTESTPHPRMFSSVNFKGYEAVYWTVCVCLKLVCLTSGYGPAVINTVSVSYLVTCFIPYPVCFDWSVMCAFSQTALDFSFCAFFSKTGASAAVGLAAPLFVLLPLRNKHVIAFGIGEIANPAQWASFCLQFDLHNHHREHPNTEFHRRQHFDKPYFKTAIFFQALGLPLCIFMTRETGVSTPSSLILMPMMIVGTLLVALVRGELRSFITYKVKSEKVD